MDYAEWETQPLLWPNRLQATVRRCEHINSSLRTQNYHTIFFVWEYNFFLLPNLQSLI